MLECAAWTSSHASVMVLSHQQSAVGSSTTRSTTDRFITESVRRICPRQGSGRGRGLARRGAGGAGVWTMPGLQAVCEPRGRGTAGGDHHSIGSDSAEEKRCAQQCARDLPSCGRDHLISFRNERQWAKNRLKRCNVGGSNHDVTCPSWPSPPPPPPPPPSSSSEAKAWPGPLARIAAGRRRHRREGASAAATGRAPGRACRRARLSSEAARPG
eukprot:scaffold23627_cov60-Phaeocystis_antarctica.AAC.9